MNVEDTNDQTPLLDVRGIAKSYGDTRVLDDVTFTAGSGEFVCIVGPSGSGKTTLLRALAALGPADSGEVRLNGEAIVKPPAELSVVFQDYSRSLMPWMRVQQNIELPLRRLKLSAEDQEQRVANAIRDVGLEHAEKLYPCEITGGMTPNVEFDI